MTAFNNIETCFGKESDMRETKHEKDRYEVVSYLTQVFFSGKP